MTTTPDPKPKARSTKKVEEAAPEETPAAEVTAENSVSLPGVPEPEPFASPYSVVGNEATDTVKLSAIQVGNINQKKSLSVHHVQRRLNEAGYQEAFGDRDGFYGERTLAAVARFQEDRGLAGTGVVDQLTLESLFRGDTNVTLDFS